MVLDAPGVESRCCEPLDRPVVEVAVGQLDALGQGLLADGEAVVLAGDLDPPRPQVTYRVVGAVVSERHLVRLAPQRQAEKLVAEADAEDRHSPRATPRRFAPPRSRAAGSPGPLERKTPSGSCARTSAARRRAGHRQDRGAPAPQLFVDGALHPVVEGDDAAALLAEGREQDGLGELGAWRRRGRGQPSSGGRWPSRAER